MLKRFGTVKGLRLVVAAFAINGCQSGPNGLFDDFPATAGSSSGSGAEAGSVADGGSASAAAGRSSGGAAGSSAGDDDGGAVSEAGAPPVGGTQAVGGAEPMGGTPPLGGADSTGGTPPVGGTESMGGTPAVGGGGTGQVTYGEPVTLESQNISNTYVISCYPQANYVQDATLIVDKEPCLADILIKPSVAEIPQDALIKQATISLACTNGGPGLGVFRPEADWAADTVTWSTRPAATVSLGTIGAIAEGSFVIDATSMVQAWVDGSRKPYGLDLRTDNTDGLIFGSSRAADANLRPKFSVTYAVPLK